MYKLKVNFSKDNNTIYISHLDLLRLFQRALRRAALPFWLTQGFSPHPKISLKRALRVGEPSSKEEAIFCLSEKISETDFVERINKELPEGVSIYDAVYEA